MLVRAGFLHKVERARMRRVCRLDHLESHLLEPAQAIHRPHAHVVRRYKGDTLHPLLLQEMPHGTPREISESQVEECVALFLL